MGDILKPWTHAMGAAMCWLSEQPDVLFLGQGVGEPGTSLAASFDGVDPSKRGEMPVAEELQMGMAIGLSIGGYVPVTCYPRWQFLLLAMNQLVNHLDKLPAYSAYRPKVIIRVASGSSSPLDPGPQHVGDLHEVFRSMLTHVDVFKIGGPDEILNLYQTAYRSSRSTIISEDARLC